MGSERISLTSEAVTGSTTNIMKCTQVILSGPMGGSSRTFPGTFEMSINSNLME
jgi:hypothetical protein